MSNLWKKVSLLGTAACLTLGLGIFAACDEEPAPTPGPDAPEAPIADNIVTISADVEEFSFGATISLDANEKTTFAVVSAADVNVLFGAADMEGEAYNVTVEVDGKASAAMDLLDVKANTPVVVTITANEALENADISFETVDVMVVGDNTVTAEGGTYEPAILVYKATVDGAIVYDNSDVMFTNATNQDAETMAVNDPMGNELFNYISVKAGDIVAAIVYNYGDEDVEIEFNVAEVAATALKMDDTVTVDVDEFAFLTYELTDAEIERLQHNGETYVDLAVESASADVAVYYNYSWGELLENEGVYTLESQMYWMASEEPVTSYTFIVYNSGDEAVEGVEFSLAKQPVNVLEVEDGVAEVTVAAAVESQVYEYVAQASGIVEISADEAIAVMLNSIYNGNTQATGMTIGEDSFMMVAANAGDIIQISVYNGNEEAVTGNVYVEEKSSYDLALVGTTNVDIAAGSYVYAKLADETLMGYSAQTPWKVTIADANVAAYVPGMYGGYTYVENAEGGISFDGALTAYANTAYVVLVNAGTAALEDVAVVVSDPRLTDGGETTVAVGSQLTFVANEAGTYEFTATKQIYFDDYGSPLFEMTYDADRELWVGTYTVDQYYIENGYNVFQYWIAPVDGGDAVEGEDVIITMNKVDAE
ncbi:MAG: hypothetical protein J6C93_02295 [Clostridia bacterium]|nr:hypothetical protein [Clostridia bacterium]